MAQWYWLTGETRHGPISSRQLKELAQVGTINASTLVWRDGMAKWAPAALIRGLVDPPPSYPVAQPAPATAAGNAAPEATAQALAAARHHATTFLRDLRSIDMRSDASTPLWQRAVTVSY